MKRRSSGSGGSTSSGELAEAASAEAASAAAGISLPWVYTAAILLLTIAGKAGDALMPTLLSSQPLLLLALNSNDLHLALTSTTVPIFPWAIVGMLRRLAEDPVFFLIGWWYRTDALTWIRANYPTAADKLEVSCPKDDSFLLENSAFYAQRMMISIQQSAEGFFRRAAYLAVVVEPGMVVCLLAGCARMHPAVFVTLNVGGTAARLGAIRGAGALFPAQVEQLLTLVEAYKYVLLAVMTAIVAASSVGMHRQQRAADPSSVDDEYVVEAALRAGKGKQFQGKYEVKWMGYPSSDNTWEPESHIKDNVVFARHAPLGVPSPESCERLDTARFPQRQRQRVNGGAVADVDPRLCGVRWHAV